MTDLYPTRTRLHLLAQVANSQVAMDVTDDRGHRIVLWPDAPTSWQDQTTVTVRVRELERAGWVVLDTAGVWWLLTDAGREVLGATP